MKILFSALFFIFPKINTIHPIQNYLNLFINITILIKKFPKFSALEWPFQAKLHAFINFSLEMLFKLSVFNALTLKRYESPAIRKS